MGAYFSSILKGQFLYWVKNEKNLSDEAASKALDEVLAGGGDSKMTEEFMDFVSNMLTTDISPNYDADRDEDSDISDD